MQRRNTKALLSMILFVTLSVSPSSLFAVESANYTIPSDEQGAGGGENARSTNYKLIDTIGEPNIGPSGSTNYDLQAGYRQTAGSNTGTTLSMSGPTSITLPTINSYGRASGEGTWTVTTNSTTGYTLSWKAAAANLSSGDNAIQPFSPATTNVPEVWHLGQGNPRWGGRLKSTSTDTATEWGLTDDESSKWLNIATTNRSIVSRSTATLITGSSEIVQFRVEIPQNYNQPTGSYTNTITMTAVAL